MRNLMERLYDNLGDPYDEIDDIRIENFVKNGISN